MNTTKYPVRNSLIVMLLGITTAMLVLTRLLEAEKPATYYLPSTSQTSYRGFFQSGATVTIDTVSVSGMNAYKTCIPPDNNDLGPGVCVNSGALDPAAFLAQFGADAAGLSVLPDATEIF